MNDTMEIINNIMNSNLFWCMCGIIGGSVLSLIISSCFHYFTPNKKRISYGIKTFPIVSENKHNKDKDCSIPLNEETMYRSKIIIRNSGYTFIEQNDFVQSRPISLSTDGKFIIDNQNIFSFECNDYTNISTKFNEKRPTNHVVINFDYLAQDDTITGSFIHTGNITFDAMLKDGSITNSYILTKCKSWVIKLIEFYCQAFILFFVIWAIMAFILYTIL